MHELVILHFRITCVILAVHKFGATCFYFNVVIDYKIIAQKLDNSFALLFPRFCFVLQVGKEKLFATHKMELEKVRGFLREVEHFSPTNKSSHYKGDGVHISTSVLFAQTPM